MLKTTISNVKSFRLSDINNRLTIQHENDLGLNAELTIVNLISFDYDGNKKSVVVQWSNE